MVPFRFFVVGPQYSPHLGHGAKSVTQFEIMPMPPQMRTENMPWPTYPMLLKITTSHEEGAQRAWSVNTKEYIKDGV